MRVKILGSGSVYGVPSAGGFWGKCNPNNLKNIRSRCSAFIEVDNAKILIDTSVDFRNQINQNNIKSIDAIFITDGHGDHLAGLLEVKRYADNIKKNINIYSTIDTFITARTSFNYLFEEWDNDIKNGSVTWHIIEHGKIFSVNNVKILPIDLNYGDIIATGFRIGDFAYLADFREIHERSIKFLHNLKIMIVGCNNGEEKIKNDYVDITYIEELVSRLSPEKTYLTYLSNLIDYDIISNKLPENIHLVYDGMVIE